MMPKAREERGEVLDGEVVMRGVVPMSAIATSHVVVAMMLDLLTVTSELAQWMVSTTERS